MKTILFTLLFAVSSWAQTTAMDVFGRWGMNVQNGGFAFQIVLEVQPNAIMITNTCSQFGRSATVTAMAPATVTDRQIIVTGTASNATTVGGITCNVDIVPTTIEYKVTGSVLTLSQGGEVYQMTRLP